MRDVFGGARRFLWTRNEYKQTFGQDALHILIFLNSGSSVNLQYVNLMLYSRFPFPVLLTNSKLSPFKQI